MVACVYAWALGERLQLREAANGHAGAVLDHSQLRRVRASLGMVFLSFNLWPHKTILENVAEGPTHVLRQPRRDATKLAEHHLGKVSRSNHRCGAARPADAWYRRLASFRRHRSLSVRAGVRDAPPSPCLRPSGSGSFRSESSALRSTHPTVETQHCLTVLVLAQHSRSLDFRSCRPSEARHSRISTQPAPERSCRDELC